MTVDPSLQRFGDHKIYQHINGMQTENIQKYRCKDDLNNVVLATAANHPDSTRKKQVIAGLAAANYCLRLPLMRVVEMAFDALPREILAPSGPESEV